MIENCGNKNAKGDHFLVETLNDMQYAKWFRPILGVSLTILFLVILFMLEELHILSFLKSLHQSASSTEGNEIALTLTAMTGSKLIALTIDAVITAIGTYFLISSFAWWYLTYSWFSFLLLVQGVISLGTAAFWLFT